MNPFNINSPIMQFLTKVADLMILNVLTIIFSIPIVTIGAATAALHSCVEKVLDDEGTLLKNYFRAFFSNFKQATLEWLLLLFLGGVSLIVLLFAKGNEFAAVSMVMCMAGMVICGLVFVWVFPLQVHFHNTTLAMLRNALICSFSYPIRSIVMLALNLVPAIILVFVDSGLFLKMGPLWLIGWFSICNWACQLLLKKPLNMLKEMAINQASANQGENQENNELPEA